MEQSKKFAEHALEWSRNGENADAVFAYKADVFRKGGQYKDALMFADKALGVNPKNEEALLCIAQIYKQQCKFAKSLKFANQVLAINPQHVLALTCQQEAIKRLENITKTRSYDL